MIRMIGRRIGRVLPAMTLTVLIAGCGASVAPGADTYRWDLQHTVGDASSWQVGAEVFAKSLNEKSDGRMTLEIFGNEQLAGGDSARAVEMVMNGETTFSYHSTIIYAGLDERFGAISAPFLYKNYDEVDAATTGEALTVYEKLTAEYGVKHLGFGENGFRQLTNTVREVNDPSDLKGMKVRIPGISMFQDIYRTLGANPVTMSFPEVFSALQQRTIDGQENPVDVTNTSGLTEILEYQTLWNYAYDPLILGMNMKQFENLSESDQQIVLEAAADANAVQIRTNREKEKEAIANMDDKLENTELSDEQLEEFRHATEPIYSKYADHWTAPVLEAVKPE